MAASGRIARRSSALVVQKGRSQPAAVTETGVGADMQRHRRCDEAERDEVDRLGQVAEPRGEECRRSGFI